MDQAWLCSQTTPTRKLSQGLRGRASYDSYPYEGPSLRSCLDVHCNAVQISCGQWKSPKKSGSHPKLFCFYQLQHLLSQNTLARPQTQVKSLLPTCMKLAFHFPRLYKSHCSLWNQDAPHMAHTTPDHSLCKFNQLWDSWISFGSTSESPYHPLRVQAD